MDWYSPTLNLWGLFFLFFVWVLLPFELKASRFKHKTLKIMCFFLIVRSLHGKSSSTGNLLEREDMPVSAPDYGIHSRMAAHSTATLHRQQRPYSMAGPGFPQV